MSAETFHYVRKRMINTERQSCGQPRYSSSCNWRFSEARLRRVNVGSFRLTTVNVCTAVCETQQSVCYPRNTKHPAVDCGILLTKIFSISLDQIWPLCGILLTKIFSISLDQIWPLCGILLTRVFSISLDQIWPLCGILLTRVFSISLDQIWPLRGSAFSFFARVFLMSSPPPPRPVGDFGNRHRFDLGTIRSVLTSP